MGIRVDLGEVKPKEAAESATPSSSTLLLLLLERSADSPTPASQKADSSCLTASPLNAC